MKLEGLVEDKKHSIELTVTAETALAEIDGRPYEIEFSHPEPGVILIKHKGKIFEASVANLPGDLFQVYVGGRDIEVKITDPKRLRGSTGESSDSDGPAQIQAAMPGKVVRILASVGSAVEKGDGILIVEAMKMQNEMKAPRSGIVREMRVAEGSTVSAGDTLATVE
ncbi:MAG: biotin/lipoyl-containing protein [Acidobacteriota bacterium]